MPNPVNTYALNIYKICKHILQITFLGEPELFFLRKFKLFPVLLYKLQFNIGHLFAYIICII